jgi:hypothetical protein
MTPALDIRSENPASRSGYLQLAGVIVAIGANAAWVLFLGYGLFELVERAIGPDGVAGFFHVVGRMA